MEIVSASVIEGDISRLNTHFIEKWGVGLSDGDTDVLRARMSNGIYSWYKWLWGRYIGVTRNGQGVFYK